ncbi:MAG: S8 family peptidase [Spirochaetales bacterium]|nr:S8 family peptidase [Spirochaetales bacterium]
MATQKYKHFFVENIVQPLGYKSKGTPVPPMKYPPRDRISHAQKLIDQFDKMWKSNNDMKIQRQALSIKSRIGAYVQFSSSVDFELLSKSLEDIRQGIRLLNIRKINNQIKATVYIPAGKENAFLRKIKDYETINTKKGKPKNANLVNSIDDIKLALLEALWTDPIELLPTNSTINWIEVWLRISPEESFYSEEINNFTKLLQILNIEYKNNLLLFSERAVILINANRDQLIQLMDSSDILAEFRSSQEPAGFWVNESNSDQSQWVESILTRLHFGSSNLKVCILDSGVNQGHQLLNPVLKNNDCLSVNPTWGTDDHESGGGHGTLMAGIIAYGQLESALSSNDDITILHKLCSVKILPRTGNNKKELYGDITKQAVSRAEIQNPLLFILYCLAVTSSEDIDKGRPSSWSGAIDELAYGEGKKQRLFLISAGNIRSEQDWMNYPNSNYLSSVQNPAQAWNALTIGAFTEKVIVKDPNFSESQIVAPSGGLSPFSTTSRIWARMWPIKPEVVFEGGNLLKDTSGHLYDHEDLCILSTSKNIQTRKFDSFNATSAATAQASWFTAQLALQYPDAWPETIRGLIVHSASWTQDMIQQAGNGLKNKTDIQNLLRVFGYGKPNIDKALYSNENAFTIILQETIQPFEKIENSYKMKDMHFYSLPWPKDLLLELGEVQVKLRITLSYFVEPGVGEIGWKDKYRYQSFGLRFDLNNATEDEDTFIKRINIAVREEDEDIETNSGSDRWKYGDKIRRNGSLHTDIWESTAAQISSCNKIAVFPVIGWWRERHNLKKFNMKTRYSLIVSLETPAIEHDIYTQVETLLKLPISIPINRS